ncbi:MAG: substrate-binding domain-containing protein [Planctomycetota bacterium]
MKQTMRWVFIIACLALVCNVRAEEKFEAVYGRGPNRIIVATASPGEIGLLQVIAEMFAKGHDATVCWRKAGSGESLKLLRDKEADAIMVHAPDAEKKAVAEGWAIKQTLIGSNEFYIVGPKGDPAAIASAKTAVEAYQKIAAARAKFLSRADNSGTHKKEMAVWKQAGIDPKGDWYVETHDFMTATLLRANEIGGYFMTDSSTWVATKRQAPNLTVLFKGDPILINVYHALCQPEGATPGAALAAKFVDFLVSEEAQRAFADFGKDRYGEALYNDAAYARQFK